MTRALHLLKTSVGASWAVRQTRELVRLGVEVHVALPGGGPRIPDFEAAGVTVHPVTLDFPIRRPWLLPERLAAMRRLVQQVQPDIIHSHFVDTTLTMRLALGRSHPIPRLFHVPGPLHLEHPFFRNMEIMTAGPADYWIGSCQWTCARYRRSGVSEGRIFLVNYGTDLGLYAQRPRGRLRAELGLEEDTRILGMVAYMYSPKRYLGQARGLKGHEDFMDAMALCLEQEPTLRGVCIGGAFPPPASPYERSVIARGRRLCGDKLFFLGTRHDVLELYPDIDVAVHPSHSENVGAASESLHLAVPTIATNVGGFPDLVIPGETGWLVPPKDPPRLAEAMLAAVRDLEHGRQMARNGQALARKLLDVVENGRQVVAVYDEVLGATRSVAPAASGGKPLVGGPPATG
jgi:glycosyltransferase involved in cell wall biosynthesis